MFTVVTDTLALVRFRLSNRPHFRGKLANPLFVTAFDHNVRLVGAADIEVRRNFLFDFVGETDPHGQLLALNGTNIADPYHLQLFLVAFLDTDDHVVDQSPGQPVVGPTLTAVILATDLEGLAVIANRDVDLRTNLVFKFSLGSFDGKRAVCESDFYAIQNGYWFISNSRHFEFFQRFMGPWPGQPIFCYGLFRQTGKGLPDFGDHLAANTLLPCFPITENTLTGADNLDSQAIQHRSKVF